MYGNNATILSAGAAECSPSTETPVVSSLNRLRRAQGFTHDVIEQLEMKLASVLGPMPPTTDKQGPQSVDSPPPSALCEEISNRISTEETASTRLVGLLNRLTV